MHNGRHGIAATAPVGKLAFSSRVGDILLVLHLFLLLASTACIRPEAAS
jgi:hypothetical protein